MKKYFSVVFVFVFTISFCFCQKHLLPRKKKCKNISIRVNNYAKEIMVSVNGTEDSVIVNYYHAKDQKIIRDTTFSASGKCLLIGDVLKKNIEEDFNSKDTIVISPFYSIEILENTCNKKRINIKRLYLSGYYNINSLLKEFDLPRFWRAEP